MIDIRRAEKDDIPGIKTVMAVTWRDTYSTFLSEEAIAKVTAEWHSPRVLEAEIARPSTFIAVATSAPSGIVAIISAHSQGEVLVVARMYVLPEFQRQGIGERMMNEACRAFPQTQRLRLDVEKQNPKGRAFYRKLGFREAGSRVDDVVGTKLDLVTMERPVHGAA
ncbi:MAG TPA: GNAT family N-acetyltransferase [Gemmatimonadaceae bacterium]|nr:GNAT family N-acetyltransferase [Gemmatimonadaceae bacterium]